MDYGIKSAALAGLTIFANTCRGSGRTTAMIERAKKGDTIIVASRNEIQDVQRELRKREVDGVHISAADSLEALHRCVMGRHGPGRPGRVLIDHLVLERLYVEALEHLDRQLRHITQEPEPPIPYSGIFAPAFAELARRRGRAP